MRGPLPRKLQWIRSGNCIIITSHKTNDNGYPILGRNGKTMSWARIIMFRRHRNESRSLHVRHTCDNRSCINPDHLIPGTNADNVRDRCSRGRTALAGTKIQTKLTAIKAAEIKRLLTDSNLSYEKIASKFGVSDSTIWNIKIGRAWKYVSP